MQATRVLSALALTAGATVLFTGSVFADSPNSQPPGQQGNSNSNSGHVWLRDQDDFTDHDSGNEPKYTCGEHVFVFGNHMAMASGPWRVDTQGGDALVRQGTWAYNLSQGGAQRIADLGTFPAGHYKLDLTEKNDKHKVFKVTCDTDTIPSGTTAGTTGGNTAGTTGGNTAGTNSTTTNSNTTSTNTTSTGQVAGNTATASNAGVNGAAGSGSVLGNSALAGAEGAGQAAAEGAVLAATGTPLMPLLGGILLLTAGGIMIARRRQRV